MPNGIPPRFTTLCQSCKEDVGAVTDGFSNHRTATPVAPVWKTSVHPIRGLRCRGSRLSVPASAVTDHQATV